jgi:hypothetical protein
MLIKYLPGRYIDRCTGAVKYFRSALESEEPRNKMVLNRPLQESLKTLSTRRRRVLSLLGKQQSQRLPRLTAKLLAWSPSRLP